MKLEELKAIRRFLKRELRDAEDLFKLNHGVIEDKFYRRFEDMDFRNCLKGMEIARQRYHYILGLLIDIEEEIRKKLERSRK